MNKWFVLVLSAMFAMAPVAVVAEEAPLSVEDISSVVDTITTKQSISGEHYGVGREFVINQDYNHSTFYSAETIKDSSTVDGIGMYVGGKLELSGVYSYGFHAANKLDISGTYERDLFAVGGEINISDTAVLPRDVYIAGNEINISTNIGGSAFIGADKIVLENVTIADDFRIMANQLEIVGEAKILGTFYKNDDLEIINADALTVNQTEDYHMPRFDLTFKNKIVLVLLHFASMIVTAVVFQLLAKNFFRKVQKDAVKANFGDAVASFGFGFGAMIGMPLIAVLLMILIIGIPAGLLVLLAWTLFLFLSTTVTASYLGARVMPGVNLTMSTILVLAIIVLINLIPYMDFFFIVVEVCFGLGVMIRALLAKKIDAAEEKILAE